MALWQIGKSWYYDFQHKRKRYRGSFGNVTKTTAKHLYAQVRAQAIEGKAQKRLQYDPPFKVYAREWLEHYRATHRPGTSRSAENHIKLFNTAFGSLGLSQITMQEVRSFQTEQINRGQSPATVNRYLAVLHKLFADAKVTPNPVQGVDRQRVRNARTHFLTEEEARLLDHCWESLHHVVVAALHTACRLSELTRLTWGDVDLDRMVLRVRAEHAKSGQMWEVPLSMTMRMMLQVMTPGTPSAPVFMSSWRSGYRDVTHLFRRAANRAGLHDVTFHDLRHTFASPGSLCVGCTSVWLRSSSDIAA
jgi:integrase